jgi:long-chain fatty acid transport protein
LEFQNTNRLAVGAHYKPGNKWIFRGGLAYDETPVRSDQLRSARIPDNDRTWLSLGFGYKATTSWSFDVGYSHLFISNTGIDNTSAASSNSTLIGTYDSSVDILSAGANFNF